MKKVSRCTRLDHESFNDLGSCPSSQMEDQPQPIDLGNSSSAENGICARAVACTHGCESPPTSSLLVLHMSLPSMPQLPTVTSTPGWLSSLFSVSFSVGSIVSDGTSHTLLHSRSTSGVQHLWQSFPS